MVPSHWTSSSSACPDGWLVPLAHPPLSPPTLSGASHVDWHLQIASPSDHLSTPLPHAPRSCQTREQFYPPEERAARPHDVPIQGLRIEGGKQTLVAVVGSLIARQVVAITRQFSLCCVPISPAKYDWLRGTIHCALDPHDSSSGHKFPRIFLQFLNSKCLIFNVPRTHNGIKKKRYVALSIGSNPSEGIYTFSNKGTVHKKEPGALGNK